MASAQSSCAIPLGMCVTNTTPPNYGMNPGDWYSGKFDAGGGSTGSFNWIDFTPPSGGQSEMAALLTGQGQCNTTVGIPVGEAGIMGNAAAKAWNSRFGLYQAGAGNPQLENAPPDFSGYSYTTTPEGQLAWSNQRDAVGNFLERRKTHDPYQGNAATGLSLTSAYNISTSGQHQAYGVGSRRLVVAPLVDCSGWASSQTVPILAYACVLMLHPITSPGDIVYMEYVDNAQSISSPCTTSGLAGGTIGPLIPVLVQ